jgi:methylenetetrahydrofolate--tRNA-(uracil-5-)-methyltransferase
MNVKVIGAGLAGCEAAWQLAHWGVEVQLYEMKPLRFSPAHQSEQLAELVCSNSLRGTGMNNAVGCLKEELRRMDSLFIQAADATAVPAGGALAVDRDEFSAFITQRIEKHPLISIMREEVVQLPEDGPVILASGPLTSDALSLVRTSSIFTMPLPRLSKRNRSILLMPGRRHAMTRGGMTISTAP